MATDNDFARVLKTTLPPTIARKLVTLTSLMDICHLKNAELEEKLNLRYYGKTNIYRRSEHYLGTFWQSTGIAN